MKPQKILHYPLKNSAIENERENFRNLFRQTPEMVCILKGSNHVFEFVNEAHIRALGFDATGLAIRTAQPESVEMHGILDNVYRTGETADLHEIQITVTDRIRYFNLTYAARRDAEGQISGVMVLGIEVTDQVLTRRHLAEQQRQLRFALANAQMGTWNINIKSQEVYFSEESYRLFGIQYPAPNVSEIIQTVIHPEDQDKAQRDLTQAIQGGTLYQSEYRIKRVSDGVERWIFATGQLNLNAVGESEGFSGIIMDITDRKRAEEDLKNALHTRDEFLSIASHELKTPLTSLKMQIQMTQRKINLEQNVVPAPEKLARVFDIADKQINRLVRIVDDLLDVSRIELGKLTFNLEPVEVKSIIQAVAEQFSEQLYKSKVTLSLDLQEVGQVMCDRFRIEQVLTNLISNALKYGSGKPIELTLKAAEPGWIEIQCNDHGFGIPQDLQMKIFDRFVRAVSYTKISGFGLGLFISQQIVRAHGGEIHVVSQVGVGSSFRVCLPLAGIIA